MTDKIVPTSDIASHPSASAWRTLEPNRPEPGQITMLKGCTGSQQTKKSAVYRLSRAGADGYVVIAKRCRPHTAAVERLIYTEILPQLTVPTLKFHGMVEEAEREFCWLFIEDAGDSPYSRDNKQHRQLAAEWLAQLHGCSARMDLADRLPDRGAGHYSQRLRSIRDAISQNATQPVLTGEDRHAFEQLLIQCDAVEARWDRITQFCDQMPEAVVHGDFVSKNMRVHSMAAGPALLSYDWECAGWGVPAADLTQQSTQSPEPDLATYHATARTFWPGLDIEQVKTLAVIGRIFRLISGIGWASDSLRYDRARLGLDKPLSQFRIYQSQLQDAIGQLDRSWTDR